MQLVRFTMIGGFLGAGKTTILGALARHYQARGLKIGIITNDQASNLVDTEQFRQQGLSAKEIPGGCFCCRFDALTDAAGRLTATHVAQRPDILLAEPVGSCTDLVATVVQPLKRLYSDQYEVAPYVVLVDPVRVRMILADQRFGGFSPGIAYIFNKQLEEADAIAINKVDMLTAAERIELVDLLARHYPRTPVLLVSGRNGEGMPALVSLLEQRGKFGQSIPEVDYDIYADAEAELGWLNMTVDLMAERPIAVDPFLEALAWRIQRSLQARQAEIAHLKMLLSSPGGTASINLVRSEGTPEPGQGLCPPITEARLILNARVHIDPAALWGVVAEALADVSERHGVTARVDKNQHFKPGRPVPTYRYAEAV